MSRTDLSETEYLRHIEHLARAIVDAADGEGWLVLTGVSDEATPLRRAVIEMARQLRHHHFDGDGCLDGELPPMKLAGVVILRPHAVPAGMEESYTEICARLGVEAQPEGWAIWNAWARDGQPVSIVLADSSGTEGLLTNWAHGIEVYPVTPLPAQVVLTRQGWVTPMTLSPASARRLGAARPTCRTLPMDSDASGGSAATPG
ncbi:hypothetical protein [Streptosporangium pseudovulgare]|uniref:Uncharacterized protein n=1 Tax=Streptosporangium pseudovulgare TaxID=35765 RepID=A0ABQ2RIZ5_9ACTN|nr:hypothetical protein [Streptosporangium pseudovulgare]GGQ30563.1 hypothetical protein GCM10010140_70810 [Streptosporangium pseudovulgare]